MIEKLDPATPNLTAQNVARIAELFPECVTEGPWGTASDADGPTIDFDLLRQALSNHVVEGPQERYRLDWPGRRAALLAANTPIDKTLRPMREDSVNFDATRNLFIEGDNLDALKLLQETYLGKVKMIYIDPPYNTGKDFIYKDNFAQSQEAYEANSGQRDDEGGRLVANLETNGRFHSDWLSMMYPRLKIARNFLKDDGVIFISIDENEVSNLIGLCNSIYGMDAFVGVFKWNKTSKAPTLSLRMRGKYEYVLCYQRGKLRYLKGPDSYNEMAPLLNNGNPQTTVTFPPGSIDFLFGDGKISKGPYGDKEKSVVIHDDIMVINGVNDQSIKITARFKWSQNTVNQRVSEGQRLSFKTRKMSTMYYSLETGIGKFIAPSDILNKEECGVLRNDEGYTDLIDLFDGESVFDYAKPASLPQYLCRMIDDPSAIIMDFFAGSGSTAQGVQQQNDEDGGRRTFILVQLPELIESNSPAHKLGLNSIADLTRERIRRAAARLSKSRSAEITYLDTGFRSFRIDSGNLHDTRLTPAETKQAALSSMISHIKDDRSDEDLLFGALLRWGVDITLPIARRELIGQTIWLVDPPAEGGTGAALIACFAKAFDGKGGIDTELADALGALAPLRVLFRDDGFASDAVKENVASRLKQRAPDTAVRVL